MQIRSGRLKGQKLQYPRAGLRPTKDMTRQAIFNILGDAVKDARICDLFAGGGSLGIEAISRGAREAVFVDVNPLVLKFLRLNLKLVAGLRGVGETKVIKADAVQALRRLKSSGFDIVFADPPYRQDHVQATIAGCAEGVVAPGGFLVIEHHRHEAPQDLSGWDLVKHGKYGDSEVSVLRRKNE